MRGFDRVSAWINVLAFSVLTITTMLAAAADDGTNAAAFVAGFDRFGRHDEIDREVAAQLLISELSCTACHASDQLALTAKGGPILDAVGRRIREPWLRQFLNDPAKAKPGTTMPDVLAKLGAAQKAIAVEALIAFLSTQQSVFLDIKASGSVPVQHEFWNKGDPVTGRLLYHSIGCVACHRADSDSEHTVSAESDLDRILDQLDPETLAEMGLSGTARRIRSVPLPDLPSKYTTKALTYFLYEPHMVRPGGRMPSLNLAPQEAADVAAYLMQNLPVPRPEAMQPSTKPTLIDQGRQFFTSLGCSNCHKANGLDVDPKRQPNSHARSFDDLDSSTTSSCLNSDDSDDSDDSATPRYHLDSLQVDTLRSFLDRSSTRAGKQNVSRGSPDLLGLSLLQMNCYACHRRDQIGGVGRYRKQHFETVSQVDLGDEGRLPPPLTHVGKKLKKKWIELLLKGDRKTRLRDHMTIRMPSFHGQSIEYLPRQFADADGANDATDRQIFGARSNSPAFVDAGRSMMDVGCIQCHSFRGEALPGVIGIDLANVSNRLHPSWFANFLLNPAQWKERTRMPTFFPDGQSQNPSVLDGDVPSQIAAMWSYLDQIDQAGIPTKIGETRGSDYEIKPTKHPEILRTFIEDVGTHAIAVGFPGGRSYAFDAEQPHAGIAWKGKFLDAKSTWFERFAPVVEPLGSAIVHISGIPSIVHYGDQPSAKLDAVLSRQSLVFEGYHLDGMRVPTFRYSCDEKAFTDRIEPTSEGGFKRIIQARDDPSGIGESGYYFVACEGNVIEPQDGDRCRTDEGLVVRWINADDRKTRLVDIARNQAWLIPISSHSSIEVTYQW